MENIIREPTKEELKDFIPLGKADETFKKLRQEILNKEKEHFKKKKPYCARCAKLDIQRNLNAISKEMQNYEGYIDFEKLGIKSPDLEEYGNADRFKLIKERDAMEPIQRADFARGTIERKIKIGVFRDYQCKVRGCGISIFISNDELNDNSSKKVKTREDNSKEV